MQQARTPGRRELKLLKTLIAANIQAFLLSGGTASGKRGSRGKRAVKSVAGVAAVFIVSLLFCSLYFGMLFISLASFEEQGYGWVYFAVSTILGLLFLIIGSASISKAMIFEAKDNSMLLSMPIKSFHIVASRVAALLAMNLAYLSSVMLPAAIIWQIRCGFSPASFVSFLLFLIGLLCFGTSLGVIMGYVISMIARRSRHKTAVTTVLSFVFFGAYMAVIIGGQSYIMEALENKELLAGGLKGVLPLYIISSAVSDGSIGVSLMAMAAELGIFALSVLLISRSFNSIVAGSSEVRRKKTSPVEFRSRGIMPALVLKEARHLGSNALYIMNSTMGAFMTILAAGFAVIKRESLQEALSLLSASPEYLCIIIATASTFIIGMNTLSGVILSVEGDRLWILKSSPIKSIDILKSKLYMHEIISLPPAVIFWAVTVILVKPDIATAALSLAAVTLYCLLTANLGLWINLLRPSLDWTNEAAAIKGMNAGLVMLLNMAVSTVLVILGALLPSAVGSIPALLIITAALLLGTALSYLWIKRRGVRRLERI